MGLAAACVPTMAVIYTDYWQAYETALPSKRHRAVGKDSGLTSYIQRFNNTLWQRVSRLVISCPVD
jgi:insertion element IS1 protein InsB